MFVREVSVVQDSLNKAIRDNCAVFDMREIQNYQKQTLFSRLVREVFVVQEYFDTDKWEPQQWLLLLSYFHRSISASCLKTLG